MRDIPVVFLIFNRPNHTRKVFDVIRSVKPRRLFVVADGPRSDDERELCHAARTIAMSVDWDCNIETNFSDTNLGCEKRVSTGLTWAFQQCEQAVILEDDCVAELTFFEFCAELLDRYRENEQVIAVTGNNFQFGRIRGDASYYFSRYPHCWGWATWRHAWKYYDHDMADWPRLRQTDWLMKVTGNTAIAAYWRRMFDATFSNELNSWAIRWLFTCWSRDGLSALPNVNLVSNSGFDQLGTHCKGESPLMNLPTASLTFPLTHPAKIEANVAADSFTFEACFKELTQLRLWTHRFKHPVNTIQNFLQRLSK